jgi:hypothetical protein
VLTDIKNGILNHLVKEVGFLSGAISGLSSGDLEKILINGDYGILKSIMDSSQVGKIW